MLLRRKSLALVAPSGEKYLIFMNTCIRQNRQKNNKKNGQTDIYRDKSIKNITLQLHSVSNYKSTTLRLTISVKTVM